MGGNGMEKLDEMKEFIQKNAVVMAELARLTQHGSLYSSSLSDEIIEQQQDLRRHARRIGVIAVYKPFFEEAEYEVQVRFDEFINFINLEECKEKMFVREDETSYHYSIVIDNIVLKTIKIVPNEEHKKAQAI